MSQGKGGGGEGWRGSTSKQWAIRSVPLDRSRIFRRSQNVMGLTGRIQAPRFVNCPWDKSVLAQLTYSICIQLSLLGIGSNLSHCLCGLKDMHGFHNMTRFIQSTEWSLMIFFPKLKKWIALTLMAWPRPIHGPSSPWLSRERTLCWQLHWCSQTESNKAPGSSLPS